MIDKTIFLILLFSIFPPLLWGQGRARCGTVQRYQTKLGRVGFEQFNDKMNKWIRAGLAEKKRARLISEDSFRIAVVVHILHQGSPVGNGNNLSAAQVNSQIIVLNEDFNRRNPDTVNTPAAFKPVAACVGVHFALANFDTLDQIMAEPGINRIRVPLSTYKYAQLDSIAAVHAWDPEKYLNIWVPGKVATNSGETLAGFAYFPTGSTISDIVPEDGSPTPQADGVFISGDHFGSNYTVLGGGFNLVAAIDRGRTTTHEIGHWLGLLHIWGNGDCSKDDFVDDTPVTAKSHLQYEDCDIPQNTCGAGTPDDQVDMFQNYMDYTDDKCMNLFTNGQKARMRIAMEKADRRRTLTANFISRTQLPLTADSLALVALHDSTGGKNWTKKWDLTKPMKTWEGVVITGARVTALLLAKNNLKDSLPPAIGKLTALERLDLSENVLTGRIPTSIGQLKNLETLRLFRNQLNGSIPPQIGQLLQLKNLDLASNTLSGTIPTEIETLIKLNELHLFSNRLAGSIPNYLTKLKALTSLKLHNNTFTGSIPADLFTALKALTSLDLSSNQLTGSIPNTVGNLTQLTHLSLSFNALTGSIPKTVNTLVKLKTLSLQDNRLDVPIPSEISALINLEQLNLFSNKLQGLIPSTIGSLTKLTALRLDDNQLTNLPDEIGNLTKLLYLTLSNNSIGGSFPATIGNLIVLEELNLSHNQLTGSIPTVIEKLVKLRNLTLNNNQLTGSLPTGMTKMTELERVFANNNRLTGAVPDLTRLTKLKTLYLSDNALTDLPNFSSSTLIRGNLRVQHNRLDALDLRPNLSKFTSSNQYSSQTIRAGRHYRKDLGSSLTLEVNVGSPAEHTYQWFFDNGSTQEPIRNATTKTLIINDIQSNKVGLYRCDVTNTSSDLNGLLLRSLPDTVSLNTNRAPTDISLSALTVAENKPVGTVIGTLRTTDPNSSDKHTYTLGGADAAAFEIEGDGLKTKLILDYETKSTYQISITSRDLGGLSYTKAFTITVSDVDESSPNQAPTDISLSALTVAENKPVGTVIGTLRTTDPNSGDRHTYTLGGADAAAFEVGGDSLKTKLILDYETKSTYQISITSRDLAGLSYTKAFTITVSDVDEGITALPFKLKVNDSDLVIYPNPSTGSISIEGLKPNTKMELEIINSAGKVVKRYYQNQKEYDLQDLAKGVYILVVKSSSRVRRAKFVLR